jgi:hypothetical protein
MNSNLQHANYAVSVDHGHDGAMMNGTRCEDFENGQISSARPQKAWDIGAAASAALTPNGLAQTAQSERVAAYGGRQTTAINTRATRYTRPYGSDSSIR